MRFLCLTAVASVLVACFSGCSTTGISATASYNPGYGPFDRNGNYVEEWADKPAQKHTWSSPSTVEPRPAAIKEPRMMASMTPRSTSPAPAPIRTAPTRPVASVPVSVSRPAEPRPVSRPPVVVASTTRPPVSSSPPPPKPKPKPAPAPAPKPTVRHTVVKGDTLYSLSRRYGTSVSAIQGANGISGTNIRLGESLKIPK